MARPSLTHVAFNVPDIDAMATFYRAYAGLEIIHDRVDGDLRVAWLDAGTVARPFLLVLLQRLGNQPDNPHAMEHLGFECESKAEIDRICERALAAGVPIVEGPTQFPPPVGYFVILADPAGNRVEFSCPSATQPAET